jgi:hypothetical protein
MLPVSVKAWLYANWFYAGLLAGLFLIAAAPLLWSCQSAALLSVFLQLPVYMVHQVEEHHQDRFRKMVNIYIGGGREALTPGAVLFINVAGVWGVDLIALYLAYFLHEGLGLIAMYLAIVNAIVHIAAGLVQRAYNPGLVSAILLLLPAGLIGCFLLIRDASSTVTDHCWGLGIAIAIHVAIILFIRARMHKLKRLEALPGRPLCKTP